MIEIFPSVFSLSNGIKVVYLRKEAFVGHLGVMIHAGSRFEKENEQGLAHFIEHCIFKGTKNRKPIDILTDLDSVGGELNAYTNKEEICVHASFRKEHFSIASELLGDIVQNPTFEEKEVEKEKEVVLDEIISYLDSPSERIFDEFEGHLFNGSSLGYNILGTKESVKSFSSEMLREYVSKHFVREKMVISFVGNIPKKELKTILETHFGTVKLGGEVEKFEPIFNSPFQLSEKKSNFQSHIMLGGYAPSYVNNNRRAMTLLINLLGGPALNSRLNLSIREKYGYAYNIEAGYTSFDSLGFWTIYLGTDKKYIQKSIDLIHEELKNFREVELSKEELNQAKEQLKGHIALSMDSNIELMFSLGKSLLIFGKIDSMKKVYAQIDMISSEEVKEMAQEFLSPDGISQLIFDY